MAHFSLIVAISRNGVIGNKNQLPWHIPEDLKWFRDNTRGKPVIMGRKTFESLGLQQTPPRPGFLLPKRPNIIITRQQNYTIDGATVVHSLEEAQKLPLLKDHTESFIIGGSEIYAQALETNCLDRLYITDIDCDVTGDAIFPDFDRTLWDISFEEMHSATDTTPKFTFRIYEKKKA